jgi:nucleoid DNA-binding protein
MNQSSRTTLVKRKRDKLIAEIAEETGIHPRVVAAIVRSTGTAINKLMVRNVDIRTHAFNIVENRWGTVRRFKKLRKRPDMTVEEKAVICYLELGIEGLPKPKELLLIGRLAGVSPSRAKHGISRFRTRLKRENSAQGGTNGCGEDDKGRPLEEASSGDEILGS